MDLIKKNDGGREYIYCPSYPSLFFALYRKQKGSSIKIVTHNECIIKFCKDFNIPIYYFKYPRSPLLFNPIEYIFYKKYLDGFIKTLGFANSDHFFLLDNAYENYGFYIAKECSKNGIVHFSLLDTKFPVYVPKKKNDITYYFVLVQSFFFKFFWGLDLILRDGLGTPIFGIDENFIKKNHFSPYLPEINLIDLKFEVVKNFSIPMKKYQILIVCDGKMKGIVNEEILSDLYLKICLKVPSLVVKSHPRVKIESEDNPYELPLKKIEHISECTPVELVLNNIDKCVISVMSSVLYFTARMNGIKAISLLDLMIWDDIRYKEIVKCILIQESDNRILFPKTIEELFSMVE